MFGLILKDFYTLRSLGKQLFFVLGFFLILCLTMDNSPVFIGGMYSIMFMMMPTYTFSFDKLAKWEHYAQSLPVTKKEIVGSKYLLSFILNTVGIAASFLLCTIILYFKPMSNFALKEQLISSGLLWIIMLFFSSLILPFIFKFGVEKARITLVAIFAVPSASIIVLDKVGFSMPSLHTLQFLGMLAPLLILFCFILSYSISVKIYSNKEL